MSWGWQWYEFPSLGSPSGDWRDADELVFCKTDKQGIIHLPRREIVPKGWYDGAMLMGRKPEFTDFSVVVFFETHSASNYFKRDALDAIKEDKADSLLISVSSDYEPPD